MGSTTRHIRATVALGAVVTAIGLAGCAGGGDGDDAATSSPLAPRAGVDIGSAGDDALSDAPAATVPAAAESAGGAGTSASTGSLDSAGTRQLPGQSIAITAHATLQAADVRRAVDRVTTAVTARGGRVMAADVDYSAPDPDGEQPGSRATLVLAVPPDQLTAVADELESLGTVVSFDQLAEDVTDQLADLDTRIANMRASVERVRALYDQAADIDTIVRLEAELTRRETDLEVALASQAAVQDRVTMSTFTVDITAAPGETETTTGDEDPGVADAFGSGWSAFVGGLFAVVLVLVAIAPFVVVLLVAGIIGLGIRQRVLRRRRDSVTTTDPAPADAMAPEREPASRQG
ncbi:MAG: DUF4349 domain-containing protein [Ilumatobacteraceae bacterium]